MVSQFTEKKHSFLRTNTTDLTQLWLLTRLKMPVEYLCPLPEMLWEVLPASMKTKLNHQSNKA